MVKKEIYDLQQLFEAVQLNEILEDGKTFVDCIPRFSLDEIEKNYAVLKDQEGFDLKTFVESHFEMPPVFGSDYQSNTSLSVEENIRRLWEVLTRQPSLEESSLINLPHTYIVPGGRFREIYYWDSYFTMLGLRWHNRVDLIESMINNFAFLIRDYGHIPNGNRRYYLSRSQPPFFALMVSLLAVIKNSGGVYLQFKKELELEYAYWQQGAEELQPGTGIMHMVQMPDGETLNRYYDNNPHARQESYKADVEVSKTSRQSAEQLFLNLRAGAESGWDFSSRWFKETDKIETIQTTDIVPVDLNCLLFILEQTIAKTYLVAGDKNSAAEFELKAAQRKQAILKYCWNDAVQFFTDYNLATKQQQQCITAAGLFPLFVNIATPAQAVSVASLTEQYLLKKGGIVTTTNYSGQQWDAPNGWAPLQWIAYIGLNNYRHFNLADDIANRWLALNEKVFEETGKLMEKYNVEDLDKAAGGGEYPGQDGFGWTNGVYVALKNRVNPNK